MRRGTLKTCCTLVRLHLIVEEATAGPPVAASCAVPFLSDPVAGSCMIFNIFCVSGCAILLGLPLRGASARLAPAAALACQFAATLCALALLI